MCDRLYAIYAIHYYESVHKLSPALSLLASQQHLDEEYVALTAQKTIYLECNPHMVIDRAALHAMLPGCRLRL